MRFAIKEKMTASAQICFTGDSGKDRIVVKLSFIKKMLYNVLLSFVLNMFGNAKISFFMIFMIFCAFDSLYNTLERKYNFFFPKTIFYK